MMQRSENFRRRLCGTLGLQLRSTEIVELDERPEPIVELPPDVDQLVEKKGQ